MISPRDNIDVITSCQLLGQVDADSLATLNSFAVRQTFTSGQRIFRQGDHCPGVFIVDQGLVRIARAGVGGQEHVLHLCGTNQSFAEVAVFADFDLPANAVAVQPTQCVMIPAAPLQAELATNHKLCRQILAGLAMWTRHFVHLLDDIVMRDAIQRVARLLCDSEMDAMGNTILSGPKKDLANHLNLSSETFSRVLKQLTERGLLTTGPNKSLRVCDPESLRLLSEADDSKVKQIENGKD